MPLWLLAALGSVRKALVAVFGVVARYPWQAACITLLLASVWLWHGWDGADAKLKACNDGRKADRAAYVTAQKEAAALAHKQRLAQEAKSKQKAENTDAQFAETRPHYVDVANRFIDTHRVRYEASGGSRGATGTANQTDAAKGADGQGDAAKLDAGFVAVPEQDVRTCTENTARLVAARDWALHLND